MNEPVLLFDDHCVMCARSVRFILAHERDHEIRFAGRSSVVATALRAAHRIPDELESIVLVEDGRAHVYADAVLGVAGHLKAPWRWGRVVGRVLPRFVRDAVYRFVARRRYRWFGKTESCFLPPEGVRERFLG